MPGVVKLVFFVADAVGNRPGLALNVAPGGFFSGPVPMLHVGVGGGTKTDVVDVEVLVDVLVDVLVEVDVLVLVVVLVEVDVLVLVEVLVLVDVLVLGPVVVVVVSHGPVTGRHPGCAEVVGPPVPTSVAEMPSVCGLVCGMGHTTSTVPMTDAVLDVVITGT